MSRKRIISCLCVLVVSVGTLVVGADFRLMGDTSDGSRAVSIHNIPLYYENEDGGQSEAKISPDDDPVMPFSTKYTCGACHGYELISRGWHFNYIDPNVGSGRPGEPWILFDSRTGTQIPISYRQWAGTFHPEQVGLTAREFTVEFGRHSPGGGAGEVDSEKPEDIMRSFVSGKLEINCLSCHNGHYGQNQGGIGGYAIQVVRENFRWAAAASSGLVTSEGDARDMPSTYDPFFPDPPAGKTAPSVTYRSGIFDPDKQVSFHILREVPNERCYYCHSNVYYQTGHTEKWTGDEDIHLTAGLKCVDCHRNGVEHQIIRGYAGEPAEPNSMVTAFSTCEGCHLEQDVSEMPKNGRLGAPIASHVGLPAVHFEKLSCTACHSGPWPDTRTVFSKTSRAHRLGTPNVLKEMDILPHIIAPVLARQADGKLAPHKMVWPAYWCTIVDHNAVPIAFETVQKIIGELFADKAIPETGSWPDLTKEDVQSGLEALASASGIEGSVGYVTGGTLYHLDDAGQLSEQADHPSARPYMWPIGHDVRPAGQALGVRYCTDCHATDAPFFFGEVMVDSSIASERGEVRRMTEYQDISGSYAWAFAFSFVFRPWFKIVGLGSCAILAAVLLLYALRTLAGVARVLTERD